MKQVSQELTIQMEEDTQQFNSNSKIQHREKESQHTTE